jgi:hypothetical protein
VELSAAGSGFVVEGCVTREVPLAGLEPVVESVEYLDDARVEVLGVVSVFEDEEYLEVYLDVGTLDSTAASLVLEYLDERVAAAESGFSSEADEFRL